MHSLRQKASEWSGIDTADAFAIDDTNLFHKLGLQTFINPSTNFTPGFTMTKKSGFDQYLLIPRKKKPFRINMNSLWNEWEDLPFIPRGKLESPLSGLAKAESSIPWFGLFQTCFFFPRQNCN
ncbi:two-on-two hemoglobin-3 [Gossypium australe]|uniref:Two-on-two hemoglobin-3 n=1 Tax=Gossypium australe TaxID=47621 RepID=A0A5B6X7T6_9ROSI|nr:two-on-two hemoglobin-3 [Gossypium australe]